LGRREDKARGDKAKENKGETAMGSRRRKRFADIHSFWVNRVPISNHFLKSSTFAK